MIDALRENGNTKNITKSKLKKLIFITKENLYCNVYESLQEKQG